MKRSLNKLKKLQRGVSRKQKGSKNRKKAIVKLIKQHQLIANKRYDFQHRVSAKIIRESQAIAIENLNVKGMIINRNLAQAISDVGWSGFVYKLIYKAEWHGKTILRIGRFDVLSKLCNVCGYKKDDLTLDIRGWECPDCKTLHNRDVNAAINNKKIALKNLNTAGTAGRACRLTGIGQRYEAGSHTFYGW
ncbi:RNA-guided endonuclease TnpB family protein [Methanolobus halotolerans]|uniref:RNA-guided endonuclease TnpB family protein n=1 Tax=Methanolobus halotolerans TaxID=2052935 RepID=UPI002E256DB5